MIHAARTLAAKAYSGASTLLKTFVSGVMLSMLMACALPLIILAISDVRVMDDAYISYRYAHNLVEGQGLVFNRGAYVEGFTNLLWTLLMTVPEALELPVHLFGVFFRPNLWIVDTGGHLAYLSPTWLLLVGIWHCYRGARIVSRLLVNCDKRPGGWPFRFVASLHRLPSVLRAIAICRSLRRATIHDTSGLPSHHSNLRFLSTRSLGESSATAAPDPSESTRLTNPVALVGCGSHGMALSLLWGVASQYHHR
jgi:hypothetical protein